MILLLTIIVIYYCYYYHIKMCTNPKNKHTRSLAHKFYLTAWENCKKFLNGNIMESSVKFLVIRSQNIRFQRNLKPVVNFPGCTKTCIWVVLFSAPPHPHPTPTSPQILLDFSSRRSAVSPAQSQHGLLHWDHGTD